MTKKWNSGFPYPMLDSASGPHFKNHVIAAHAKHTSDSVAQVPWTLEARGVVFHALAFAGPRHHRAGLRAAPAGGGRGGPVCNA